MKARRGISKKAERMDVATEWMKINEMEIKEDSQLPT